MKILREVENSLGSSRLLCFKEARQWQSTPVLFPGKSHGQRILVGCSPWSHEELDTTERLHFHFSLSCIREGNGNPLQSSCLENPKDGGDWWAAIYGITQSQTQLKDLAAAAEGSKIDLLIDGRNVRTCKYLCFSYIAREHVYF